MYSLNALDKVNGHLMSTDLSRNAKHYPGTAFTFLLLAALLAPKYASADPLIIKVPSTESQQSLADALLTARQIRRQNQIRGSIIIELSAGIHRLSRPLEISFDDFGSPEYPLVIRAEPGAIFRLLGSRPVFPH
jgi:hypothetical protein